MPENKLNDVLSKDFLVISLSNCQCTQNDLEVLFYIASIYMMPRSDDHNFRIVFVFNDLIGGLC